MGNKSVGNVAVRMMGMFGSRHGAQQRMNTVATAAANAGYANSRAQSMGVTPPAAPTKEPLSYVSGAANPMLGQSFDPAARPPMSKKWTE